MISVETAMRIGGTTLFVVTLVWCFLRVKNSQVWEDWKKSKDLNKPHWVKDQKKRKTNAFDSEGLEPEDLKHIKHVQDLGLGIQELMAEQQPTKSLSVRIGDEVQLVAHHDHWITDTHLPTGSIGKVVCTYKGGGVQAVFRDDEFQARINLYRDEFAVLASNHK